MIYRISYTVYDLYFIEPVLICPDVGLLYNFTDTIFVTF